jgi:hypothetical protein
MVMNWNIKLLSILLLLTASTQPVIAATAEDAIAGYHRAKDQRSKVEALISVINHGVIKKNVRISRLKLFLPLSANLRLPKVGHLGGIYWPLEDGHNNYYFTCSYNSDGLITRYDLSNFDSKSPPYESEKATDHIAEALGEKFRKARTPSQKLKICIDALDAHVLFINSSEDLLAKVFGRDWVELDIQGKGKVFFVPFCKSDSDWRLYFFIRDHRVTTYFISNCPNYFGGIPEAWWKDHY